MRDRAVPEGRRGVRRHEAAGDHPVRRPRLGARPRRAAAAAGILCRRRAHPRHLLWRAGDGASARRQGRGRPSPRIRPRRGRGRDRQRAARRRVAARREISGVDEPWRPGDRTAQGFPRRRHLAQCADRHDRRRGAAVLCHPVPPRSRAHAPWRGAAAQLRARHRRLRRRLDHARLQGRGDREDPRPGRAAGPGDLRPLRRRRFRGGRGADPRGDRRAAHLRVRRPRPAAPGRRPQGGRPVPRQLQHPAGPCGGAGAVPRRARRRHRPRGQAQDHRRAVHRRVRGAGETARDARAGRRRASSPRARSIPT